MGWDQEIPETMPAEDVTRTAKWAAIFTLSETGETITGLTEYGKNNCAKLIIPAEVDGVEITAIRYEAFYDCSQLTSVKISDSVTSIGDSAFYDCSGLTSITIPESVTSIGDYAINSERDLRKTQHKTQNNIENSLQMIA